MQFNFETVLVITCYLSDRLATMAAGSSTRDLRQAAGINEVLNPFDPELEVPCTEVHALCKQVCKKSANYAKQI